MIVRVYTFKELAVNNGSSEIVRTT